MASTGADDVYARSSPVGGPIADFEGVAPFGGFFRSAGTLILHSGETVAQVELHSLADERPVNNVCTVYGTAIPTS